MRTRNRVTWTSARVSRAAVEDRQPLDSHEKLEADIPKEGHMDPVNQAIAYTVEHGGGTFEADTLLPFTPSSGYAVGYGGARISASAGTNVIGMLLKVIPEEYEASFVGTWLSGDLIHIDAVQYFADYRRDAAIAFAASTGQEAIYDFAAGESIYLQEVTL